MTATRETVPAWRDLPDELGAMLGSGLDTSEGEGRVLDGRFLLGARRATVRGVESWDALDLDRFEPCTVDRLPARSGVDLDAARATLARVHGLDCPAIVPTRVLIRDTDGHVHVVTAARSALTLRALASTSIPVTLALDIAGDLAMALDALHGAGLVHGSLGPENVVVRDGHGGRLRVWVTGVERELLAPSGEPHESGVQRSVRARHLAPELASEAPSPSSDIYALAAILREILGGEATPRALAQGLHVLPQRRPRSASELVDALREELGAPGDAHAQARSEPQARAQPAHIELAAREERGLVGRLVLLSALQIALAIAAGVAIARWLDF